MADAPQPTMARMARRTTLKIMKAALQQGVLYHEVDQGMPCYSCKDCPGFEMHWWRKACQHCRCTKGNHGFKEVRQDREIGRISGLDEFNRKLMAEQEALQSRTPMRSKANDPKSPVKAPVTAEQASSATARHKYSWVPDGLDDRQIELYMSVIPLNKRPIIGSEGDLYRIQQLERQMPLHDIDVDSCSSLETPEERAAFEAFCARKVEEGAEIGRACELDSRHPCYRCGAHFNPGDMAVQTDKIVDGEGNPALFHHDTCFVCEVCDESLVDLVAFVYDGDRLLCGRHYADMYKPRCGSCDESIMAKDFTMAEDQYWHLNHFCCRSCDTLLVDQEYVTKDSDPICIPCHDKEHAQNCAKCKQLISVAQGKAWHTHCFTCIKCNVNLQGVACFPRDGNLYCREDYYAEFQRVKRKSIKKKVGRRSHEGGKAIQGAGPKKR